VPKEEIYIWGDIMENITYTFKEVCEKTGYKSSVIRYYEKEFKLNIPRDTNGRRVFTQRDFEKLLFIKQLQKEGYTNGQIKKILNEKITETINEIAAASEAEYALNLPPEKPDTLDSNIIRIIEEKFNEISNNLNELNQNVSSKERDILISENLKLKMEIKQKSYELIELKEKLRYEKDKNKGFFKKIFKKV
jgi:DNA-binding transcriptional MerR regulator